VVHLGMKFKTGTDVYHRENPSWRGVVVRDLHPRRPVNGKVLVIHNGRTTAMYKTLLKKVTW